jgi:Fe-Mn family superoxide dismutase
MAKKFQLPNLPYDYAALEPVIQAEIMHIHHQKHHQTYVTKLNEALEKYEQAEEKEDLDGMISLQPAIKFNAGGHINHSIFWTNLAPKNKGGGEPPKGELLNQLNREFGSIEKFIEKFNAKAALVQGSGWCWLGFCQESKSLLGTQSLVPLLGIDVWEHAYYLQYKNARMDYLKAIWGVVNWMNVSERFEKAFQLYAHQSK